MCEPALMLCLLLWIGGTAVSRTQGQVTAPASVTVEVGRPVQLGCNITTAPGNNVLQVRWLNKHSKLILAYQIGPLRISLQDPNVQLTASNNQVSFITIKSVQPGDEGCYRCAFDVFPRGAQEAKTCVKVTGRVRQEGNETAVNGKPVTLSCWYNIPDRVQQVLWRKTAEQGDTATVATYARHGHHSMAEQFVGRVSLSHTLGETQLTIQEVRMEDEACYTCEFHTYPDGTKSSTACLSVYVLPKPEVTHVTLSSGVTEANCTAQSRPAAEITWDVGGENRTHGPPILTSYEQGDGTTIVTSTLLFQSGQVEEKSIKCIVHHPGLEDTLSVPLSETMAPTLVILYSVCGVAVVLLLCLCVCLCKCFICTDD